MRVPSKSAIFVTKLNDVLQFRSERSDDYKKKKKYKELMIIAI